MIWFAIVTVSFIQPLHTINEHDGRVLLQLILSEPLNSEHSISVIVETDEITAKSKYSTVHNNLSAIYHCIIYLMS